MDMVVGSKEWVRAAQAQSLFALLLLLPPGLCCCPWKFPAATIPAAVAMSLAQEEPLWSGSSLGSGMNLTSLV